MSFIEAHLSNKLILDIEAEPSPSEVENGLLCHLNHRL